MTTGVYLYISHFNRSFVTYRLFKVHQIKCYWGLFRLTQIAKVKIGYAIWFDVANRGLSSNSWNRPILKWTHLVTPSMPPAMTINFGKHQQQQLHQWLLRKIIEKVINFKIFLVFWKDLLVYLTTTITKTMKLILHGTVPTVQSCWPNKRMNVWGMRWRCQRLLNVSKISSGCWRWQ